MESYKDGTKFKELKFKKEDMVSFNDTVDIFFFNDTATTEIYTLSLHDALPICVYQRNKLMDENQISSKTQV